MDQNELFRRYLDLGASFTQVTRERAEEMMRDLVRLGDLQLEQAQGWVDDVLERSRKNTEALLDLIRDEVSRQLSSMSLVTKDDVSRLVSRLQETRSTVRKSAKKAAKRARGRRAPAARAKKAPAKKKAATRKTAAKRTTAKRTTAKKSTAKKSAAKRTTAKKSTKKAGR